MQAAERGTQPRRIGLRLGMTLGFGGLVLIAVVLVLALGLGSAQKNTTDLQSAQARIAMDMLRDGIESHLKPVEEQTRQIALQAELYPTKSWLDTGGAMARTLVGALAGNASTFNLVLIRPGGALIAVERVADAPAGVLVDVNLHGRPVSEQDQAGLKEGQGFWGPIIRHPYHGVPIINYRFPVFIDGAFEGVAVGVVRIDQLSRLVATTARNVEGEAFILYGERHVLAHPSMVDRKFPEESLPLVEARNVHDPVLQIIARGGGDPLRKGIDGIDARFVDHGDTGGYLTLAQTIRDFGEIPWKLVLSYRLRDVSAEFQRMIAAAIAGVVVLIISVIVAVVFARGISRPLTRLADYAEDISNLNLHGLAPLPHSRIREVDEAAMSMNAMRNGLTWFEAYVPKRLVTRLMASEGSAHLGGEARQITVMFTDIVGFTPMAEHMGAEETAAFLNDHFRLLADAIEEHGGTIDKFIGDAVMAFWGAPEDQSDHSARAIDAALAIREALTKDNQARAARGLAPVRLRVGIHAGPVVVGNIGAPRRMNYTIVGDTVNTANRLEQAAREQDEASDVTILISDAARDAAGKVLDAREVGEIALRGREHGVRAWLI